MCRDGNNAGPHASRRRGAIFIELAFVILIAYVFFAYFVSYARVFHGMQVVQNVVDIAARETSRVPLPANVTFEELLDDPNNPMYAEFSEEVYSEDFLVIPIGPVVAGAITLEDWLDFLEVPLVNRALIPLMFQEDLGGPHLRYPGTLVLTNRGTFSVLIPIVQSRAALGEETIGRWARVLEEVESAGSPDPFRLTSPEAGMVQLRLNYPHQSAAALSFRTRTVNVNYPMGTDELNFGFPNYADDGAVTDLGVGFPAGWALLIGSDAAAESPTRAYGGQFGLGAMRARPPADIPAGKTAIRPWRRVVSAQSFHRREVFQ